VGGIYALPKEVVKESALVQLDRYAYALSGCIREHPLLSATIQGSASKNPVYTQPKQLDLRNHFRSISTEGFESSRENEAAFLNEAIEQLHNDPKYAFASVDSQPAWAIDLLPLASSRTHHRTLISFTYSHSHGDGMSGLAFHRTFQKALQENLESGRDAELEVKDLPTSLLGPPDTTFSLPISWSYLLRPLLGTYLPTFLSQLLGISASISGANERTWTGSKTFTDAKTPGMQVTTSVQLVNISTQTTASLLAACKKNNGRLTAFLNNLIARALKETLATSGVCGMHFASVVPINLRKTLGLSNKTIGLYAGGKFLSYDCGAEALTENELDWNCIWLQGQELALAASTLRDQPIGLLRYVSNFRSWLLGQVGEARDCSWELSNLGGFDPREDVADSDHPTVNIEQMLFSQSATPNGHPIQFSVVGVKRGGLWISMTWQVGALGLSASEGESQEERDRAFVKRLAASLSARLEMFGMGG
jgi:Alcohol acetyltransferase